MVLLGTCSGGIISAPAPIVTAPATVGYTQAIPYNIPPHASRIDVETKALAAPILAAYPAPIIGAVPHPAPIGTAPIITSPGGFIPNYIGLFGHYSPVIFG